MQARTPLLSYSLVILSMLFWGMTFVWVKIALEVFSPVTILLIRLTISASLLWAFLYSFKKMQKIQRKHLHLFAWSALTQPFLYFIGETYGLSYVSSSLGSIIISTIPVFMPFAAWFYFRESLGAKNLAGFLFAFVGVMLMVSGEEASGSTSVRGILFLFMAVMAAIINTITVKRLTFHYNAITIVAVQNVIGIFYFLPLFFILDFQQLDVAAADWRIWRNLIALAIFGSTFAFIFFTHGIRHIGISQTGIFSNLIPVFTAVFAFFLLGESFPWIKVAGMAIVIAGVLVVSMRKMNRKSAE